MIWSCTGVKKDVIFIGRLSAGILSYPTIRGWINIFWHKSDYQKMLIPELTLICRLLAETCQQCNFSYRLPLIKQPTTLDGSVSFTYRMKWEPRGRLAETSRCPPWLINTSFRHNSLKKNRSSITIANPGTWRNVTCKQHSEINVLSGANSQVNFLHSGRDEPLH
jgi:hypothetical protein